MSCLFVIVSVVFSVILSLLLCVCYAHVCRSGINSVKQTNLSQRLGLQQPIGGTGLGMGGLGGQQDKFDVTVKVCALCRMLCYSDRRHVSLFCCPLASIDQSVLLSSVSLLSRVMSVCDRLLTCIGPSGRRPTARGVQRA